MQPASPRLGMIYWPPMGGATRPVEMARWISTVAGEHGRKLTVAVDWQAATRQRLHRAAEHPWS